MLYIIRFAKYNPNLWHKEFIGYVFEDKPECQYALCIEDLTESSAFDGMRVIYKKDTWYAWGEVSGAI